MHCSSWNLFLEIQFFVTLCCWSAVYGPSKHKLGKSFFNRIWNELLLLSYLSLFQALRMRALFELKSVFRDSVLCNSVLLKCCLWSFETQTGENFFQSNLKRITSVILVLGIKNAYIVRLKICFQKIGSLSKILHLQRKFFKWPWLMDPYKEIWYLYL